MCCAMFFIIYVVLEEHEFCGSSRRHNHCWVLAYLWLKGKDPEFLSGCYTVVLLQERSPKGMQLLYCGYKMVCTSPGYSLDCFEKNHVPKWYEHFRKSLDPGLLVRAPFSTNLRQIIYATSLPVPWRLSFPAAPECSGRMDLGTCWAIESYVEMGEEKAHSMWKLRSSPMLRDVYERVWCPGWLSLSWWRKNILYYICRKSSKG